MSKIPSQYIFKAATHGYCNMQGIERGLGGKRAFLNQTIGQFSRCFTQFDFCNTGEYLETSGCHQRIAGSGF